MSFLNKIYTHNRDENFKEFVDSLVIPDDKVELLLNFKPSQSLKKEGDQYIYSSTTPGGGNREIKFTNGVEFDDEVAPGIVGKSKFTVEGNVVIQNQKFDDLSLVYRREYSDDELVVIITTNKWDGTTRRYYKAA